MIPWFYDLLENPEWLHSENEIFWYGNEAEIERLKAFLDKFSLWRKAQIGATFSAAEIKKLPFGEKTNTTDWQWRRASLEMLKLHLQNQKFDNVLEIGAWNGWLTRKISTQSNRYLAFDYWPFETDGLGAIEFNENLQGLVADVQSIDSIFKLESFDLIIINHALQHTVNPVETFQKCQSLMKPGGQLISVGNTVYKQEGKRINQLKTMKSDAKLKFDFDLYFHPIKGVITWNDKLKIQELGGKFTAYQGMWKQRLKALIQPTSPTYELIHYRKS